MPVPPLEEMLGSAPAALAPILPSLDVVFERTLLSIFLGFMVALVYRLTLARRDGWNNLSTTLVLLCVLIGLVTLVSRLAHLAH